MAPNRWLVEWLRTFTSSPNRKRCLVTGCGLGDDAEALASAGYAVTAFDSSATAIVRCHERFPRSGVEYVVADVLDPPAAWAGAFDLVFDVVTLQVLLPEPRGAAIRTMASLVAPGGRVFVVCRAREADEPIGEPPWPLTRADLDRFVEAGLREGSVEIVLDDETPPVRWLRAFFEKSGAFSEKSGS